MANSSEIPQSAPLAGRYRIERRIGEGAHATTWLGHDERLDRPVAIKILRPHLAIDPVFVQRFEIEAKAAASIRHANVVDVYDFGREGNTLYIVMQYVDGETLRSAIDRQAPLRKADIRRITIHILDGLAAIHEAGIIHRDVKPQNILIGSDGIARLTDFGIAEISSDTQLTAEGLTLGTVDYMSPEQAQGVPLTPASDLYATGVILYEMLTGTLPFHGDTSHTTMMQHINGTLVPPSVRLPSRGIDEVMDAVVMQSLARDPSRRFFSAGAMKQAVRRALTPNSESHQKPRTSFARETPVSQAQYPITAEDEGMALRGAFRGLVIVIIIGLLGVGIWGAAQVLDRMDLSLPSLPQIEVNRNEPRQSVEPNAASVPTTIPQHVEMQPAVVDENAEWQDGTQSDEIVVQPENDAPPIEPMDEEGDDNPVIEPLGKHHNYDRMQV